MRRRRLVRAPRRWRSRCVAAGSPSRRSRWPTSSPCGTGRPTRRASGRPPARAEPPTCDGPLCGRARSARLELHMSDHRRTCDRPARSTLAGDRDGARLPLARATPRRRRARAVTARRGSAIDAWTRAAARWQPAEPADGRRRHRRSPGARGRADAGPAGGGRGSAASTSSRARGRATAGSRSTARSFRLPSRRSPGSSATPTCHRWRGELDYWVFLDGQLGQVDGQRQRRGGRDRPGRAPGTVEVRLTATDRGRDRSIYPPTADDAR